MGKKRWIVVSLLSSLVVPALAVAAPGYQESTKQMVGAFATAFGWLPAVLKIKSVVFGVLLIFFWIFLYNLLLTGVKKWLVKEGEVAKMHKTLAGSLAAVMLLSVFFVTPDPMAKAQQIAGSFHMFFAVMISLAVYFISKHTIRSNTDGKSGGFQSIIIGGMCLLLFTYLAEGSGVGFVKDIGLGIALLAIVGSLLMKVGGNARGWGCEGGHDAFGDQTDQIPRSPGSIGDAASIFGGKILNGTIGAPGWLYGKYKNRKLSPQRVAFEAQFREVERDFKQEIINFEKLFEFYNKKLTLIPDLIPLYDENWGKCKRFLERKLPRLLEGEKNYIQIFLRTLTEAENNVEELFREMAPGLIAAQLTDAQKADMLDRIRTHENVVQAALGNLDSSLDQQIALIQQIEQHGMETQELLQEYLVVHLRGGSTELTALQQLRTAVDDLIDDARGILAVAGPAAAAAAGVPAYVAEISARIDIDTGANSFKYELGAGMHEFRTLRELFDFFRDLGPQKDFLFGDHYNTDRGNDFVNWIDGTLGCPALAAHIGTLTTAADLRAFIRTLTY